ETAVCNLGSINLVNHIGEKGLDLAKLARTCRTAVRMLDNVIEINYYSVGKARNSNLKHRPVGLGFMGFQDSLQIMRIPYASEEAVEFADASMEAISYFAILASSELAKERGEFLQLDRSERLDWSPVREHIAKYGMRNSNVMAIAPTATISNIVG